MCHPATVRGPFRDTRSERNRYDSYDYNRGMDTVKVIYLDLDLCVCLPALSSFRTTVRIVSRFISDPIAGLGRP